MTRSLSLGLLLVLLPLLTACDSYVEFTVVNATDAPIKAGWSHNGCPRSNGPPPRLSGSQTVAPRSQHTFEDVTSGMAHCVMITSEPETVRLYESYTEYGRYTISAIPGQPGLAVEVLAPTVTP